MTKSIIHHPTALAILENTKMNTWRPEFQSYHIYKNGMAVSDRFRMFYTGELEGERILLPTFETELFDEKNTQNFEKIINENKEIEFKISFYSNENLNLAIQTLLDINKNFFKTASKKILMIIENNYLLFQSEKENINFKIDIENKSKTNITLVLDGEYLLDFFRDFVGCEITFAKSKNCIFTAGEYNYLLPELK